MEYLVMECGRSYAIVLDSEGRFLKVPNLGYEVGQTLDHVVLMDAAPRHRSLQRHLAHWAAVAACLCIMVMGSWGFWQSPVGTVRMQINPDIQMSVNRLDRVIGLKGLNEDGEDLIRGYRVYGKKIQTASDELADRAMELGYLSDGGRITLTVESGRERWKTETEELLLLELDVHFEHRIIVAAAPADAPDETVKDVISTQPEESLSEQTNDDNDDPDDDLDDNDVDALDDDDDDQEDDDLEGPDDLEDDDDLDDAWDDDSSRPSAAPSSESESDGDDAPDDPDNSDDSDLDDAHSDQDDGDEDD